LREVGYRRLRYPQCDFEANRDRIGKLNIGKKVLKMLRIKAEFGSLAPFDTLK